MALAMGAGITSSLVLETVALRFGRDRLTWQTAAITAFNMSFISMASMEIAENVVDISLTGGVVDVHSIWWWLALAPSIAAGFVAAWPYNYYQLRRYGRACH